MNKQKNNLKMEMKINEEFLYLFSSEKSETHKTNKITDLDSVNFSLSSQLCSTIDKNYQDSKLNVSESSTLQQNNFSLQDNIDSIIEIEELRTIKKLMNIVDKFNKLKKLKK
jgi:hypothetical protein